MVSKLLSKSRYLNGLQCPKLLWTSIHEPDRIPQPDATSQYIFDQGHMVGELAKELFPGGIYIPAEDFVGNIRQTRELLKQHNTIFEAGISAGNIYARADILNPVGQDEWDIIEVKSSTRVKDIDLHDVAFQRYCYQQSGLGIRKCFLMHINNDYVRCGDIDHEQLFATEDITDEVEIISRSVPDRIDAMLDVIAAAWCPDVAIGKQCRSPYDCPLTECWDFLPENSVFDLYRGGQKSFDLMNKGVLSIKEIPDDFSLADKQQIQKECVLSGQPYVDRAGIRRFLSTLNYPLHYLDFETFSTAIPMFDGTRPYQNIPFQFSLHVVADERSEPEHFSFLAEGTEDPRPRLLPELAKGLDDKGSIIVYNQAFEKGVLKELGSTFPEYGVWTENVCGRIIDLLVPFRNFYYYHPLQRGRASLKNVLPAMTGKSYERMEIADGLEASLAFQQITYGDVSDDVRARVREDLKKYCTLDTEGMTWIVDELRGMK